MGRVVLLLWMIATLTIYYGCERQRATELNLDFERVDSRTNKPKDWLYSENGYEISNDKNVVYSGKYSLRIESVTDQKVPSEPCYAGIQLDCIQGNQKIRISGFLKNEDTYCDSLGFGIWYGTSGQYFGKFLKSEHFKGSHDWQEYSIELTTVDQPEFFMFGIQMSGNGILWVDDIRLYIDDIQAHDMPSQIAFKANREEIKWLKNNCVPIETVQAETGFKDLQPLKEFLSEARIVAIGENTHGTGEIFEMKHRLLEFLSSEMGYSVFAIEDPMFDTDLINDFVQSGDGDPKKMLQALTPAWNTREVLNMILWMREFNQQAGKNLSYIGIDMQSFRGPLKNLSKFASNDPPFRILVDSLQLMLPESNSFNESAENREQYLKAIRKCNQILSWLAEFKGLTSMDVTQYEILIQSTIVIRQFLDLLSDGKYSSARDRYMADNVSWILDHNPEAKIVLWAHNEHISKEKLAMGDYLSKRYGDQYYSIGFLTNEGKYTGSRQSAITNNNELVKGKPGSIEYNFSRTGVPIFFLDFNSIDSSDPNSDWLNKRLYQRIIGSGAIDSQFWPVYIKEKFDGVIFINSTNPSKTFLPIQNVH